MHDTRARDGSDRLISIREVGRESFGRSRRRTWIAANQAEWLVRRHKKLDEFVADGAARSKDSEPSETLVREYTRTGAEDRRGKVLCNADLATDFSRSVPTAAR